MWGLWGKVLVLVLAGMLGGTLLYSVFVFYRMFARIPSPFSLVVSSTPPIIKMSPDIVKCPQEAKIASGSEPLFQEVGKINYRGNKVH